MYRQYGRHLNPEYYLEIELLNDNEYFSSSYIARRKFNKDLQNKSFTKMFHSIYQFGVRNGLPLFPDNGAKDSGGKYKVTNGKAVLLPGERSAKWLGKTWKSKLYIDDRRMLKKYVMTDLLRVLTRIQKEKAKNRHVKKEREMGAPGRKVSRKLGWWTALLTAGIVLTGFSLYNYNVLQEGFGIMRSQGTKAVLEYFQNRGETFETSFGIGWNAFQNGDYETAEKYAHRVLKSRSLENKAQAWYLLGVMETNREEYDQAEKKLLNAHAIYESIGKTESQYRTQLILARLYLTKKDIHNAAYYINLAGLHPKAISDEYFLFLQSNLAFIKSDFDTALSISLQREKLEHQDRSKLAEIYGDISFYYCLVGNLDQCFAYTIKAQSLATEQENPKATMHNNINMCLYLKCSFQDYSTLREAILAYARNKKDIKLLELMVFVEKFSCPLERIDKGDPPPPGRVESSTNRKNQANDHKGSGDEEN